jgi:hypothetical protein
VGPGAGLDAEARREIFCPRRGSNPDRTARSQTLYCLSYRGYFEWNDMTMIPNIEFGIMEGIRSRSAVVVITASSPGGTRFDSRSERRMTRMHPKRIIIVRTKTWQWHSS